MNRTLISMIRKSAAQAKDKWVEMLPLLEFAYNNSVHRATTVTPFLANQRSHPVVPASLLVPDTTNTREPREYADWVAQQLKDIWETVRQEDAKEAEAVARRENPKRGNPTYQIGDEVMCRRFHLVRALENKRKQDFTYDGPFVIKKIISQAVVKLDGMSQGAPTLINTQFLRKYHRDGASERYRATPTPPKGGDGEWEVEAIEAHRGSGRATRYLVRWKGYLSPI